MRTRPSSFPAASTSSTSSTSFSSSSSSSLSLPSSSSFYSSPAARPLLGLALQGGGVEGGGYHGSQDFSNGQLCTDSFSKVDDNDDDDDDEGTTVFVLMNFECATLCSAS